MSDTNVPTFSFMKELLAKIANYLLVAASLCYLSGFAITNIYIGSLGIANVDILRSRYILSGLLFLGFVGGIAFLVYGFYKTLLEFSDHPRRYILKMAIRRSVFSIFVLCVVISTIGVFAGSRSTPTVSHPMPQLSTVLLNWIQTSLLPFVLVTGGLLVLTVIVPALQSLALTVITFLAKTRAATEKMTRPSPTKYFWSSWVTISRSASQYTIFLAIACFVPLLLNSLISGGANTPYDSLPFLPSGPWWRYFFGMVLTFILIAIFVTYLRFFNTKASPRPSANPLNRIGSFVALAALLTFIVVPAYAMGIYPALPQQIGGGNPIKVTITTSNADLKQQFADPNIDTYLVDRTSSSTLLVLASKSTKTEVALEAANDQVETITYLRTP